MPDPATREFSYSYNNVVIGGAAVTNLLPHGRYRINRDRDTATVEFEFLVTESVEAAFRATCLRVETAFDEPYKSLTIRLGSQVIVFYPDAPSAECIPRIEKVGDPDGPDTARTRLYRVTVNVNRAAKWSPISSGLRELEVDVSAIDTERKTLKISGTWTSVSSAGARARYDAAIAALVSSVQTDVGGTWEQVGEGRSAHDLNDFTLEFEREYREIKFSQGGASVDDAALVEQTLTLRRSDNNPEDSERNPDVGFVGASENQSRTGAAGTGKVRRLTEITAEYEAGVRFSQSTDLAGKLDSIRSWIISQIEDTFGVSSVAIVSEDIGPIAPDNNRIKAHIVAVVAADGQKIIERRITLSDDDDADETMHKVFTGKRFSRLVYGGMGDLVRTLTISEKRIGSYSLSAARQDAISIAASMNSTEGVHGGGGGGKWTLGRVSPSVTPIRIGTPGSESPIEGVQVESSISRTYYEEEKGSGGTKTPGQTSKLASNVQFDVVPKPQGLVKS